MKKKLITTSLALIWLIGSVAGVLVFLGSPADKFAEMQQLQERLLDDSSGMTMAERRAGWRQVKRMWATFSESEQLELTMQHQSREQQKVVRFRQLETEEERLAFLDAELADWAAKLSDKRGAVGKEGGSAKGAEQRKAAAKKAAGSLVMTSEAMRSKERRYLESTSPELRAYHSALKERWIELHGEKN